MTSRTAMIDPLDAVQCGVEVTMSDGIKLVADLWGAHPRTPGPVVLERTPYGRHTSDQAERQAGDLGPATRAQVALAYLQAGFAYCSQDCRGTGKSGGEFHKYVQEGQDTTETIAWLRSQSWCDGCVVTVGFSYGAACQLAAIVTAGDAPDAAVLDCGGFSDALTSGIRQGGALALKQATWCYAQALRDAQASGDEDAANALLAEDLMEWLSSGSWVEGHTPLSDYPQHQANLSAMWQQSTDGPYWDRAGLRSPAASLARAKTKALFVTSWFDTSLRATLENYTAMASPDATCPRPELIVGPWSHGDRWSSVVGEVDQGAGALPENGLGASFQTLRQRFLQNALSGDTGVLVDSPPDHPVHYFELGTETPSNSDNDNAVLKLGGCWRYATAWPPDRAEQQDLFLSGFSLVRHPGEPSVRTFLSDPSDPVPTLGGAINSGGDIMPGGMYTQMKLDGRDDIVRFQSHPFGSAQHVVGNPRADIWVKTTVPDFDLTAKLVLILADGTSLNLGDGICRARHRHGFMDEDFFPSDEPALMSVELNPVAVRVAPGQSLRLDLAGSNFPCFDINPQTGAPQGQPCRYQKAEIHVLCGQSHSSKLVIMTVPA